MDQIVAKLRKADVELGKGKKVPEVCKLREVAEDVLSLASEVRWHETRDGQATESFLEKENARLKKMVAEQALDMEILKEASKGNW